jgi:hypothetical protein
VKSLLEPWEVRFLGERCLVFVAFIKANTLRLTIAQSNTPFCIYLNVDLLAETIS